MINYLKGKGWTEKRDLAKAIGQKDVSNLSRNIRSSPGVFETKKEGKRNLIRLTKKGKKALQKELSELKRISGIDDPEIKQKVREKVKAITKIEKAEEEPTPKNALMIKGVHISFGSLEKANRFKEIHERDTGKTLIVREEALTSGTPIYRLYIGKEPAKPMTAKEAGEEAKALVKKKIEPPKEIIEKPPKEIIEVPPEVEKKVIAGVSIEELRRVKRNKAKLKDLIVEWVLPLVVREVNYSQYGMKSPQEYRTRLLKMIDLLRKSDGSWIKHNIRVNGRNIKGDDFL